MKIVQYTVNINNYDPPRKDIISLNDYNLFRNDARNSRAAKILSHKFIDADISIYWDANKFQQLNLTSEQLVENYLGDCDIAVMKCSTGKDCIYQEIEGAKQRVKHQEEINILNNQYQHYKNIGIPEHIGTLAGFMPLIRRHNDKIKRFNEAWWAELCRWSYRDQIAFPIVLRDFPDLKVNWTSFDGLIKKSSKHSHIIPNLH